MNGQLRIAIAQIARQFQAQFIKTAKRVAKRLRQLAKWVLAKLGAILLLVVISIIANYIKAQIPAADAALELITHALREMGFHLMPPRL